MLQVRFFYEATIATHFITTNTVHTINAHFCIQNNLNIKRRQCSAAGVAEVDYPLLTAFPRLFIGMLTQIDCTANVDK